MILKYNEIYTPAFTSPLLPCTVSVSFIDLNQGGCQTSAGMIGSAWLPFFHDSNSARGMPDCRMIDCNVPILISLWSGTGTVIVPSATFFCNTIWLPRLLTSIKPCWAKIAHTSFPERIRSLPNRDLDLRQINFSVESLLDFFRGGRFKK